MVEHPRFAGSIREVTIDHAAGTWFACLCLVGPSCNGR